MSEWTSGYVADIDYTYGYYPELNPQRCRFGMLHSGVREPQFETACELGFGQGLSSNIHASASDTEWWGTDFNPAQASFAQELAKASGCNAHLFDQSFSEFCLRDDLPNFDYIALHGIWSWISDENRKTVVDFVRRKLNVGGVLYISYNTLPGWTNFVPVRHLMTRHAEVIGAEGQGIVNRIDGALDFTQKLLDTNPLFKAINPRVEDRVKKMKDQNRQYLAHEFFNKDWHPMHFATTADWLDPAKVDFACSAHFLDHIDQLNFNDEQKAFIAEIPDAMLQQSVRDFVVNQQFRRDYWVKGARRYPMIERAEALTKQRIILTTPRDNVSLKVTGGQGEASMNEDIYGPILDVLQDHKVTTIAKLQADAKKINAKISAALALEAVMILSSGGHINPVQSDDVIKRAKKRTDKLNHLIQEKARSGSEITHLACPITGGGISVPRFHQLFLRATRSGASTPEELGIAVWKELQSQGQLIIREGQALQNPEDNIAELTTQAKEFVAKNQAIYKALAID